MKIKGTKGDDVLTGTSGDDIIKGRKGADVLVGGDGVDIMKGGKGHDLFVVSFGDTILDFQPGKDKIFIDQHVEGPLYMDSTGIYAGYTDHPVDLIVNVKGYDFIGGLDLLGI